MPSLFERLGRACVLAGLLPVLAGGAAAFGQGPVDIHIETTLPAWSTNVAALAFDGDPDSYFQSRRPPDEQDVITVTFLPPVYINRIIVDTGDDLGAGRLVSGLLAVSGDTRHFRAAAEFAGGKAEATLKPMLLKSLRIRPTRRQKDPLVLREIVIAPRPAFRRVIQDPCVIVDASQAPDLADWGAEAAVLCKEWYPRILQLLPGKGYQPPLTTRIKLVDQLNGGVGMTVDTDIQISAGHVRARTDGFGVVIHELTHVVQGYAAALSENEGPRPPTWLMEGIADYIRFYHFEAIPPPHRIDPRTASYSDSYQTTATFLNWIEQTRARDFVKKLNADIRSGKYDVGLFQKYAGERLDQLWQDFIGVSR